MKKQYTKPTLKKLEIQIHNLCAGSQNTTKPIDIYVLKRNKRKSDFRTFSEGSTNGMWSNEF